jgi:predicted RNA-binding Zn ribbon-like protein
MPERSEAVNAFEFLGGQLCLDFANTLSDRPTAAPVELLHTYEDLLIWSQQANILNDGETVRMQVLAEDQPARAANWLVSIKQVRELLYRIFSTLASGETAQTEDMHQFNQILAQTMAHACLVSSETGFTWDWTADQDRLGYPLWPIVRSAANLLTSPELSKMRICASDDCGWLFLDTSKNHSRRWCDMKSCGNRAKARRHYGRKKGADGE